MIDNGWEKYQKQVLYRLELLEGLMNSVRDDVVDLRVDVRGIKAKAGIMGAIAGGIPALVAVVAVLLHHFMG